MSVRYIELADYLTKRYKIQFKLDRSALRRIGYSPRMEFSATAVGLPLKIALDRDLNPLGLQTRVVESSDQAIAGHRSETAVRGKDNVPAGIAGHDLRQHLLIAFVGAVAEAHAAFVFEARKHGGIDIGRPVVDIQARAPIARACG